MCTVHTWPATCPFSCLFLLSLARACGSVAPSQLLMQSVECCEFVFVCDSCVGYICTNVSHWLDHSVYIFRGDDLGCWVTHLSDFPLCVHDIIPHILMYPNHVWDVACTKDKVWTSVAKVVVQPKCQHYTVTCTTVSEPGLRIPATTCTGEAFPFSL